MDPGKLHAHSITASARARLFVPMNIRTFAGSDPGRRGARPIVACRRRRFYDDKRGPKAPIEWPVHQVARRGSGSWKCGDRGSSLGLRFAPGGMRANVAARSEQPNWHDAGLPPSDRHLPKQRSKLNPLASRCCAPATVPPSSTNAAMKPARIAFIRTFCRSMAQPHNETCRPLIAQRQASIRALARSALASCVPLILQHQPGGRFRGHTDLDAARSGHRVDDRNYAVVPGARALAEPRRQRRRPRPPARRVRPAS